MGEDNHSQFGTAQASSKGPPLLLRWGRPNWIPLTHAQAIWAWRKMPSVFHDESLSVDQWRAALSDLVDAARDVVDQSKHGPTMGSPGAARVE
jgi:hypothetical protein